MSGQLVICKDFTGNALVRRVWVDSGTLVFIHTEEQFEAHKKGLPHLEPVGFPVRDVFMHNPVALEAPDPWKLLQPYSSQRKSPQDKGA